MKSRIIPIVLALASASLARADFNPVPLTPGSFTADVIVEKTAQKAVGDYTTLTMDGGTNNNAWVWMERGIDNLHPDSGLLAAGTTFAAATNAAHQFQMPPSYATNNAVALTTNGIPDATLTISSPAPATTISLLHASGGASSVDYTINYQGGGTQSGSMTNYDWHNVTEGLPVAWICNGRFNTDNGQVGEQFTGKPRLFYTDIALTDTVNPVASITFHTAYTGRSVFFGLSTSTDGVNFTPAAIGGFNRDVVVESSVPITGSWRGVCTVIMDSGATNFTGNTWYERGLNTGSPTTGLPLHGTNISGGTPLHTFTMPASYTANNVLYIGNYTGYTTGTLTLTAPAAYTRLSFLGAAGNGPMNGNVTVHYSDTTTEAFTVGVPDWFNQANPFYTVAGRLNPQTRGYDSVGSTNPRLYTNDIALTGTATVTSIDFTYVSGGRAMIFAVAGQTVDAGTFSPVPITGYNADGVVEAGIAANPNPDYTAVNASMDGGTNKTGNTWYERGYYHYFPNSGLPPAGSTIDSLAQPDHHYTMPASYAANNCIFVDPAHPTANLTIASPQTYSAISFLSATANGNVTNQAVMQYADGTSETNTFISRDWFNNTPFAYSAYGRVNLDTRTINNDPGRAGAPSNPRFYEAQFALGNTGSAVTNVVLTYLNPTNSNGRGYIFAVSATAGAVPPIIASISVTPNAAIFYEGSNVVFNAIITGGTAPITYQWQKGTNGVYANLTDGGRIAGATTTNMTIASAVSADSADYRLVASNVTGPVNSGVATLGRMLSALQDVTAPGDPISITAGSTPAAEAVAAAIDNRIQKYLNWDADAAAPFIGPVGFIVKPTKGNTIVNALRIYTANDSEGRDPADYVLAGSLDGSTFTPISSGALALSATRNTVATDVINPLTQAMQEVRFANTAGYNYYRMSFNNVKDNAGSTSMQLGEVELLGIVNPNPPPMFTVSPTDVAANEGTTATFTSLAVGAAPLTYQWYDVTAGEPGTLLVGKTSPNLELASVTLAQSGSLYRVVATNPYGSVTNPSPVLPPVQLTVNSGPVAIATDLQPEALFYIGRTEQLSIGVTGSSPFYQWQSNGVDLVDGGRISGAKSNVLTIANLQFGDAASYQVITSNLVSGPLASAVESVYVTAVPTFHTNGVGWQLVNAGASAGFFSGENELTLTDLANEQRAAWFKTPMNIDGFKASFVYQDVNIGGADGVAFVIQNSPQGTNALGGGGGALAYSGMPFSAAVMFNIYAANTPGIAFRTNGAVGAPYDPTPPVDISNGDPIQVNLSYAGSTLQVTLSNTVTAGVFTTNYAVGSLSATVGTNVAYVGITAATGGTSSYQLVRNFQYIPLPTASAQNAGGTVKLTWPASIGGYGLQSTPSLTTPVWSAVGAAINQVNGQNEAAVAPTNGVEFYRLTLPSP